MLIRNKFLRYPEKPQKVGGHGEEDETPSGEEEPETAANDEAGGEGDDEDFYADHEGESAQEGKEIKKTDPPAKPESSKAKAGDEESSVVAGYSGDEKPEEEKVEEPEVPAEPIKTKDELGFELDLKDVSPADAKKLVDFAKANKLPEDAAKALVEMRKNEASEAKAAKQKEIDEFKKEVEKQKAAWTKELRTDKDFGGENFKSSLALVGKVLDLMPGTKEQLTKSGNMLPAYVMKDLSALGKKLFETESLVNGDPASSARVKEEKPEDFYGDHEI